MSKVVVVWPSRWQSCRFWTDHQPHVTRQRSRVQDSSGSVADGTGSAPGNGSRVTMKPSEWGTCTNPAVGSFAVGGTFGWVVSGGLKVVLGVLPSSACDSR